MTRRLVIFGVTGDLARRKLIPALAQLNAEGRLPDDLAVVGVSREDWDDDRLVRHAKEALTRHAPDLRQSDRDAVLSRLSYRRADVSEPGQVADAVRGKGEVTAYLALPPTFFAPAVEGLAGANLPKGSRVIVEKPFGDGLESAKKLNRLLLRTFDEDSVYRIDHFLHKQTVQNVLGLRFANRVFERLWDREQVERVEIVWDETLGLEGRAGYYDTAGALKDMVQNHLLQLMCLVAMEPPVSLSPRDLRDRKMDVLRAVRVPTDDDVRRSVRARYTAGKLEGQDVPGYAEEEGVDPSRETETFAEVTLYVDNWRWAGVPFVLRSGKGLAGDRREAAVYFRPVPHLAFESRPPAANVLRMHMDPDRLALGVNVNGLGDPFDLELVELDAAFPPQDVPAYGRLLLSVLEGDPTLSIRADEAEEAWRIMEPILAGWKAGLVPLREYPAGTPGDEVARGKAV